MAVDVGTRLQISWEYDSYEAGDVSGSVIGWLPNHGHAVPACVLRLDARLHTLGVLEPGGPPVEVEGDLLILVSRYVGQTWAPNEGTVHAGLCDQQPDGSFDSAKPWPMPSIASHAVYRIIA